MLTVLRGPTGDPFCSCYSAQGAFRWLPALAFSYSYSLRRAFHGGNTGSNPVGDANFAYSLRNATIGSTPAARRAGINDASSAAMPSRSVADASITGSHGLTPYS
jgi:hypothetical protein